MFCTDLYIIKKKIKKIKKKSSENICSGTPCVFFSRKEVRGTIIRAKYQGTVGLPLRIEELVLIKGTSSFS